jgi:hypothetical protein
VPVERADRFVPDPYEAVGDGPGGTADVLLNVAGCDGATLDGRAVAGRVVADVGIAIASPDGSPGAHLLQLAHLDQDAEVAAAMERVGVAGGRVPGLAVTPRADGASATAPWPAASFAVDVSAALTPAGTPDRSTWWHRGPRGLVRLAYRFPRVAIDAGRGRVTVAGGTSLAELLGGTDVGGRGFVARLDFAGTVDAERRDAGEPAPGPAPAPGAPTGPPAPAAAPARPALRLALRPRTVRAGRRVRLVARVRPAARDTVVRVAGRRARTDARGIARLTVRLPRGTHRVTARRPGHRAAVVRIRAR